MKTNFIIIIMKSLIFGVLFCEIVSLPGNITGPVAAESQGRGLSVKP